MHFKIYLFKIDHWRYFLNNVYLSFLNIINEVDFLVFRHCECCCFSSIDWKYIEGVLKKGNRTLGWDIYPHLGIKIDNFSCRVKFMNLIRWVINGFSFYFIRFRLIVLQMLYSIAKPGLSDCEKSISLDSKVQFWYTLDITQYAV